MPRFLLQNLLQCEACLRRYDHFKKYDTTDPKFAVDVMANMMSDGYVHVLILFKCVLALRTSTFKLKIIGLQVNNLGARVKPIF